MNEKGENTMNRKVISLLLIFLLCVGMFPVSAADAAETGEEEKISFTDVPGEHIAYDAVMNLAESGVISGKGDELFAPEDSLKREEFAKILVNALKISAKNDEPIFEDVLAGMWYAPYVRTAAANNLVEGIGNNKFGVGTTLSRQDMALIALRYLEKSNVDLSTDNTVVYADSNDIAEYAKEAVEKLASARILPIGEDNCIRPLDDATRADAAMTIYNAMQKVIEYNAQLGLKGENSQYSGPYAEDEYDSKLLSMMPKVFDPANYPSKDLVYIDFESEEFPEGVSKSVWNNGTSIASGEGVGYNGSNGCLKVEDNDSARRIIGMVKLDTTELSVGDYYEVTGYLKAENIVSENTSTDRYYGLIQQYEEDSTYRGEGYGALSTKDTDWTYFSVLKEVKGEINDLTPPAFQTIRAGILTEIKLTGTVYVDDIRIKKVVMEPMDTVLVSPAYKGLIYGDGGIGDIHMRANIRDGAGYYSFDNYRLETTVTDRNDKIYLSSVIDEVTPTTDVFFSSASLPMDDDYYITSALYDKTTDKLIHNQTWIIRKRQADYKPRTYIDEYNRMITNGEPVLPVFQNGGIDYDEYWAMIEQHEYINSMTMGQGWFTDYKNYEELLNKVRDTDRYIVASPGYYVWGYEGNCDLEKYATEQKDLLPLMKKVAKNTSSYDRLLFYYLWDEMDGVKYGEEFRWMNDIFGTYAIDIPTSGCVDKLDDTRPGIRVKMADFLLTDPYPVTGKPDQDLSLVYNQIQDLKEISPNRAIGLYAQGFWYDRRGDLRAPTEQEYRNMIFQALCAGVCAFDSYSVSWNRSRGVPGEDADEYIHMIFNVLEEVGYLSDIYLSVEPAPYYEVKGGGTWLNTTSRRYDGKSYLFAVNNQDSTSSARFNLDGVKKITEMYTGDVYEVDSDGWFDIRFENYATMLFEYEQEDYKSSHAELEWFGITGGDEGYVMLNALDEVPTFVVPADAAEVEYSVALSDFAAVSINGVEMEAASGKFNLADASEIVVKVTSQDGRFSTEKTYKVKRQ